MSLNSSSTEPKATANGSGEEDPMDSIYKLIDKKLETTLVAYARSLATEIDVLALSSNYRFEIECDRMRILVQELFKTHENNVKEIVREQLGLTDPTRSGDFGTNPGGDLEASSANLRQPTELDDLSPMARKFFAAGDGDGWQVDDAVLEMQEAAEREKKKPYFFYGSLMDASTLKRVLGLEERPQLKPASIVGYDIKMWGPYPALQDGPPGNVVPGMMWEVEGTKGKDRLAEYETCNYKECGCIIEMGDGSNVWGTTFMWNGDASELKEGSFDLKDWQMNQLRYP